MSQYGNRETSPNGPLILPLGNQSFTCKQIDIITGQNPKLTTLGLQDTVMEIPSRLQQHILAINRAFQTQVGSSDNKYISAFWLGTNKMSLAVFRIPIITDSGTSPLLALLHMDPDSGANLIKQLNQESTNKSDVQNFLSATLKGLEPNRILADRLLSCETNISQLDPPQHLPNGQLHYHNIESHITNRSIPSSSHVAPRPSYRSLAEEYPTIIPDMNADYPPPTNDGITLVETEDESLLQSIADQVTDRGIWGKFKRPVFVRGLRSPQEVGLRLDFGFYTNRDYTNWSAITDMYNPSGKLWFFQQYTYNTHYYKKDPDHPVYNKFGGDADINIFSYTTHEKIPNTSTVSIQLPVYDTDASGRPVHYTVLYFFLPTSQLQQLLNLIDKNPDNHERFIQIAFEGIHNITRRSGTNNILIVDVNNFLPPQYSYKEELQYYGLFRKKNEFHPNAIKAYSRS